MNQVVRQTSALALTSLISGILGWTFIPFIGSVVAVITGHMARSNIRQSQGALDGDGLALAGLILGYAMIVVAILAIGAFLLLFGGIAWLASMQN